MKTQSWTRAAFVSLFVAAAILLMAMVPLALASSVAGTGVGAGVPAKSTDVSHLFAMLGGHDPGGALGGSSDVSHLYAMIGGHDPGSAVAAVSSPSEASGTSSTTIWIIAVAVAAGALACGSWLLLRRRRHSAVPSCEYLPEGC